MNNTDFLEPTNNTPIIWLVTSPKVYKKLFHFIAYVINILLVHFKL